MADALTLLFPASITRDAVTDGDAISRVGTEDTPKLVIVVATVRVVRHLRSPLNDAGMC